MMMMISESFMMGAVTVSPQATENTIYRRRKVNVNDKEVNPLECRRNYSATSNNMKLVHWPVMGGLLHLVQRGARPGPSPLYHI